MNTYVRHALTAALLFVWGGASNPAQAEPGVIRGADNPYRIADQYIVVLNRDLLPAMATERKAAVQALTTQLLRTYGGTPQWIYDTVLYGFAARMTEAQALALSRDPRVAFIEADEPLELDGTQTNADWGLDRIDQRTGTNGTYVFENTATTKVDVYILDTGIRSDHTDFAGGRVHPLFSAFGGTTEDCDGHGTNVAGLAGGATYGVAKGVTLWAVRVLDCTGADSSKGGLAAGVNAVAKHHQTDPQAKPAAVANMSLHPAGLVSDMLDQAVRDAISGLGSGKPVTFVASAGNDNTDACNQSPARVAEVITAAATDKTDTRAVFSSVEASNFGSCVDLFAPGVNVRTDSFTTPTATELFNGTSASAPLVTGRVALFLETHPSATPAQVADSILGYNVTHAVVKNAGTFSPNKLVYSLSGLDLLQLSAVFQDCGGVFANYTATWDGNYGAEIEFYNIDITKNGTVSDLFNGTGTSTNFQVSSGASFKLTGVYTISQGTSPVRDTGFMTAPSCTGCTPTGCP